MPTRTLREGLIRGLERAMLEVVKHANQESHGLDGVTIREFCGGWPEHKRLITAELKDGRFRFQQMRGVVLPKDPRKPLSASNARPISVPAVRDRVVQRAILDVLWVHLRDQIWTPWSFGGIRPYKHRRSKKLHGVKAEPAAKSVRRAIEAIVSHRREGASWVFETDIQRFFPSINKQILLPKLVHPLPDESINDLLTMAVDTTVGNADRLGEYVQLWDPESGVPQGSILSPMLANLYLHDFDQAVAAAGYRLVRYVDDLVVLAESEVAAGAAYELVERELKKLSLNIHPLDVEDNGRVKSRVVPPGRPFDFLGVTVGRDSIRPTQKNRNRFTSRIDEVTDVKSRDVLTLSDVVRKSNAIVRGWLNAQSFCNFSAVEIEEIDRHTRDRIGGWLQKHGFTRDRNVLTAERGKLLGLRPPSEVELKPIYQRRPTVAARSAG